MQLKEICLRHLGAVAVLSAVCWVSVAPSASAQVPPPKSYDELLAEHRGAAAKDGDPCSLLDQAEVEAALGGSLAVLPFRVSNRGTAGFGTPDAQGGSCWYMLPNWEHIVVEVEWRLGARLFKGIGGVANRANKGTKGQVSIAGGTLVDGDWDDAMVLAGNQFVALVGDRMVTVDVKGSEVGTDKAGELAGKAIKRLDHPLPINGTEVFKAARAYLAGKPGPKEQCEVLTQAEVEKVVGPLSQAPMARPNGCEYHYKEGARDNVLMVASKWKDGFGEMRGTRTTFGRSASPAKAGAHAGGTSMAQAAQSAMEHTSAGPGPWTIAETWQAQLLAAKKDVFVTVQAYGMSEEKKKALMAAAMAHI
jgi:hypothetical protein